MPELECKLLAGAPAIAAQLVLAVLAMSSLVYKRHRERPQRPYTIWCMDVTKQVFSSGAGHVCGVIIALLASRREQHLTSECAWYFVAFSFDTTLGVTLAILLHRAFVKLALRIQPPHDSEAAMPDGNWAHAIATCGDYGEPPSWHRWAIQMGEWVFATVFARFVCGLVVVFAHGQLNSAAKLLDRAFFGHVTAELFVVMICCPLLMNMIQAWLQDAVLKLKRGLGSKYPVAGTQVATDRTLLLPSGHARSDLIPASPPSTPLPSRGYWASAKRGPLAAPELPTAPSPMEASRLKGS